MKKSSDKQFIGYRTGKLVVIGRAHSDGKCLYWKCKCNCGNIRFHTKQNILSGNLKSCGCFKEKCRGRYHKNWKGRGDISAAFVCKIKSCATRRKLKFLVDINYLWRLFEKQMGKCALTALPLQFPISHYDVGHGKGNASLDRINSNLGYTKGNVQWVHKDVNMMKQEFSQNHFIKLCKLITKNYK